jgi:pyridoxamine 5'-phosphate oxidase-like protein
MATWAEFAVEAPAVAEAGRRLIYRAETGSGLLATVRGDSLPRIHPITVAVSSGRLVAFIIRDSPKARDLAGDGRYALHAHHDPDVPHEFTVRGRATAIDDAETRAGFAGAWKFEVDETYRLFEFGIDHAIHGQRATPRDWPPRYTSWRDQRA